jgi:gluconate 5-dehydrogenase
MSTFDVTGKVTVITGASYGLGEVFALGLAEAGSDLVLAARSVDLLESVADRCRALGRKVTAVRCDVSSEEDVHQLVKTAVAEHGRIDVLVNNAGVADLRGLGAEQFDTETFRQIVEVDLIGAFMVARECGKQMLAQGAGSIINICSIMASGANETGVIAYSAAKGGLRNMTMQLGCEWADRGVRVNAISPGFIVTEMTRPVLETIGLTEYIASRTPMRRVGDASELLGPLLFLASDASSYVTGLDLLVDGGTNAANGYYQMQPVHHGWGHALDRPMVGEPWSGLAPLPERFDVARPGVPGIHYVPEEG